MSFIYSLQATWNDASATYNGIELNISNGLGGIPSYHSGSLLLNLQNNGTVVFGVDPNGLLTTSYGTGTLQSTNGSISSVKSTVINYGADPTGVADSTAAFNTAIAANNYLIVPPGTYKLSALSPIVNSIWIACSGEEITNFNIVPTTGDIFNFTGPVGGSVISGCTFNTSAVRTSGSYVTFDTLRCYINRVRMNKPFIGLKITGNATFGTARDLEIRDIVPNAVAASSAGIFVTGTGSGSEVIVLDRIMIGNTSLNASLNGFACIYLQACDALTISNTETVEGVLGLLIAPLSGQSVLETKLATSYFDSTSFAGMDIAPGGTGNFAGLFAVDCWFSGSTGDGILLSAPGSGATDGIDLTACQMVLNAGSGINIASSAYINTRINGGIIAQNNVGITTVANVSKLAVQNATIGPTNNFTANGTAIVLGANNSHIRIQDNDVSGNGATITGVSNLSGTANIIANNIGYNNPVTTAVIAVGVSPFTYTAGPSYETVYVNAGTVSLISVNGVGILQASPATIQLGPYENTTVTYTVLPSLTKVVH